MQRLWWATALTLRPPVGFQWFHWKHQSLHLAVHQQLIKASWHLLTFDHLDNALSTVCILTMVSNFLFAHLSVCEVLSPSRTAARCGELKLAALFACTGQFSRQDTQQAKHTQYIYIYIQVHPSIHVQTHQPIQQYINQYIIHIITLNCSLLIDRW